MWINRGMLETILHDNKHQMDTLQIELSLRASAETYQDAAKVQKAKDDMTIDWMRHRINALEKERAILLMKAAGIMLPVPEITPTIPRTLAPGYDHLPSFEDVGDIEAKRLGLRHTDDGVVEEIR